MRRASGEHAKLNCFNFKPLSQTQTHTHPDTFTKFSLNSKPTPYLIHMIYILNSKQLLPIHFCLLTACTPLLTKCALISYSSPSLSLSYNLREKQLFFILLKSLLLSRGYSQENVPSIIITTLTPKIVQRNIMLCHHYSLSPSLSLQNMYANKDPFHYTDPLPIHLFVYIVKCTTWIFPDYYYSPYYCYLSDIVIVVG